jgi:uncharacterized membrane protein
MNNQRKIASVRPSPLASKITIVMLVIFLFLGLFLMSDVPGIFTMVWVIACIGGIIYSIRNLSTYSNEQKSKLPATATDVIEIQSERETATEDFETKLRKLESLKKDGLITDEEYIQKRKEIMDEKW